MNIREFFGKVAARIDLQKVGQHLDIHDAFTFGGLALVAAGLAQVYPPAAYIVPGAFFMWLGIQGAK